MKVTARATRSDGWWAIDVPEVDGAYTQARRLDQVAPAAAKAVALLEDVDVDTIDVTVEPTLDSEGAVIAARARETSAQAAQLQLEASAITRDAVRALQKDGLTVRDVATILGISPQRVSQLATG